MVKRIRQTWVHRTFKRELSVIFLAFWILMTGKIFFSSIDFINAIGTVYGTASTSIWLFAIAAFGLDAASKQLGLGNGPTQ